jgi:hypothetical protein
VTPEQHEQQRLWVAASLQVEAQREHHHDTYPRRSPRAAASAEPVRTEAGGDAD